MPRSSALDITRSLLDLASPTPAQDLPLAAAGGAHGGAHTTDCKIKAQVREHSVV